MSEAGTGRNFQIDFLVTENASKSIWLDKAIREIHKPH
jgi:hypothetical protein